MAGQVFALLVGINKYQGKVGKLKGCVNDVKNIQSMLQSRYQPDSLEIEMLKDDQATRANIIDRFRNHLGQAGPADSVVFHYSGHGARSTTAPEFRKFDAEGMEEGLVCVDSRHDGKFDLSNKELAVLINEVSGKRPHIACIIDCCHSGSATRNFDESRATSDVDSSPLPRLTIPNLTSRTIESYLDGIYEGFQTESGAFEIPPSKHILLSACQRDQLAWETTNHCGAFTSSLIEVLDASPPDISYADLFVRCRHAVRKRTTNQDPQFRRFMHFDSYQRFLGGASQNSNKRFTVYFDQTWKAGCGAIHGLPTDSDQEVELAVFEEQNSDEPLCHVVVSSPGADTSEINEPAIKLDQNKVYPAKLTSMPVLPLPVYIEGATELISELIDLSKQDQSLGVEFVHDKVAKYGVKVEPARYSIFDVNSEELLSGIEVPENGSMSEAQSYILGALKKIAVWERTCNLNNPACTLDRSLVRFEFHERPVGGESRSLVGVDNQITVAQGVGDSFANRIKGELKVQNHSGNQLNFALFHLSYQFGIASLYNEPAASRDDWVTITPNGETVTGFFCEPHEPDGIVERLKLIVSEQRIDTFILDQEGTPRGIRSDSNREAASKGFFAGEKIKPGNDWFTIDLQIKMVRNAGAIPANNTD